jgi:uncharacterized protein YciI
LTRRIHTSMFIVFLRFGAARSQAGQWLEHHNRWLARGIEAGLVLLAGSLEGGQGGALIMANLTRAEVDAQLQQDPFVSEGVVVPEVHEITPVKASPDMPPSLRPATRAAATP